MRIERMTASLLVSYSMRWPGWMMTSSPALGTAFSFQVEGFDQSPLASEFTVSAGAEMVEKKRARKVVKRMVRIRVRRSGSSRTSIFGGAGLVGDSRHRRSGALQELGGVAWT